MAYVLLILFVAACGIAVIAWLVLAWNMIRVPFNLQPGVDVWASGNPFNYLFRPEVLTAEGLVARRRAGISLMVFAAAVVAGAVSGSLLKWLA